MAKGHSLQTNFTGGEISPLMYGRVDVKKYQNGASRARNCLIRPQGGGWSRHGSSKMSKGWLGADRIRLLPFVFSDQQKYLMEFGQNYIHFFKNREPLLETTNAEVEAFTVADNGGFMQIRLRTTGTNTPDDLPGWGHLNLYGIANNGTIAISDNGSGLVRLTTSIPNTLRTGVDVVVRSTALTSIDGQARSITGVANNGSGLYRITMGVAHGYSTGNRVFIYGTGTTADGQWTITVTSATEYDLVGSTFGSTSSVGTAHRIWQVTRASNFAVDLVGSTYSAPGAGDTAMFSHGLKAGDRFYISGGAEYPELSEKYHTVKSVESIAWWTVANVPYVNHGTPTMEEAHVIPIEIATPYNTADVTQLKVSQSADVVYITHPDYPTCKLTRLDDDGDRNDWFIADVDFYDGPYLPLNDAAPRIDTTTPANGTRYFDVFLEVTNYSHTATVLSATTFAAGSPSADQGKYLEYRERDQWKLALVTSMAGGATSGTVSIIDNVLLYIDETTKLINSPDRSTQWVSGTQNNAATNRYLDSRLGRNNSTFQQQLDNKNSIQGASAAGNLTAQYSNTFSVADVGKYIRYVTTANPPVPLWALIDGVSGTTGTVVHHAASVTMVSNNATGKFIISNEVRSCTVKSFRGNTSFSMFASTDVGRHIRLGFGGRWTWGKIATYVGPNEVTVTMTNDFPRDPHNALNIAGNRDPATPDSGITYDWRLGAWSGTTGYPAVSVFHEQRLWFGRTTTEPQTQWGSRSGDYENFSPSEPDGTVLDDNSVTYTIVSGKVSPIKWMSSGPVLLVGGQSQEWQARAASNTQEPITPTNISVTPQTNFGSADNVPAQQIGPSTIFADRVGRKIREMSYSFELDRHVAVDLSIVAEHFFKTSGPIIDSEYQKHPFNIYWAIDSLGNALTMTYERDHEVVAWSKQTITDGFIESICVLTSSGITADPLSTFTHGSDEVYVAVRRFINGAYAVFIEVFYLDFEGTQASDKNWMPYLDGSTFVALTAASTTINGLNDYEGETVQVLADGVFIGDKTVSGGAITLSVAAQYVRVGYTFTAIMGILPIEAGAIVGTAQAKTKRVNKVGIRVKGTNSIKTSSNESGPYQTHQLGTFYSGDKVLLLEQGYNLTGEFYLVQDLPEPMNILLVAPELGTYEEQ